MPHAATIVNIHDRIQPRTVQDVSRSSCPETPRVSSPRPRTSGQIVHGRYKIGSLYRQPSGCWAARITDLIEGKTFKRSSGTRKKGDVLKALEAVLSRPEPEKETAPPKTFSEAVSEFLEFREPQVRATTMKDYRHVCSRLEEVFGSNPLSDLTYSLLERHITKLAAEGKGRAAHKHLVMLRMLLSWAVRRELIEKDPSTGLKAPRYEKKEHRIPSPDEAREFLQAASQPYIRKILALGFLTGLRRATILSLRVSDLDVSSETLSVDGSRMKGRRAIHIPVRDDLLALLLDGLPSRPDARLIGKRLRCFKVAFESVRMRSGMPWFVFHSTRRYFASQLAAAGTDYFIIKELLGHSLSGDVTTLYINSAMLAERKREAVNRLPAIL